MPNSQGTNKVIIIISLYNFDAQYQGGHIFIFHLNYMFIITLTNNYLAFFIYQLIILWTQMAVIK